MLAARSVVPFLSFATPCSQGGATMARRVPPLIWHLGGSVLFLVVVSLLIKGLTGVFHPKIGQAEYGVRAAEVRALGERRAVEARLVSVPVVETAMGTISAVHETTTAARIPARVTEVNVSAGEQVEKGAVSALRGTWPHRSASDRQGHDSGRERGERPDDGSAARRGPSLAL
jgi:hypothetical protein